MASTTLRNVFRSNISNFIKFNPVKPGLQQVFNIQQREFRGSKRNIKIKAQREKAKLERELENKYGISSEKFVFNANHWIKNNYLKELDAFQTRLNINFNNKNELIAALIHPSFLQELEISVKPEEETENNTPEENDLLNRFKLKELMSKTATDKFALIGYEVAVATIKRELYACYPNITHSICEDVTKFLVSREVICKLSENLNLNELILLSSELEETDIDSEMHVKFTKNDVISDMFFALIGAIETDIGSEQAQSFVTDFLFALIYQEELSKHVVLEDPESELEEILAMNKVQSKPHARLIAESGVATDFPFFYVGIYCSGCKIGEGSSYSIALAKQDAFKNTVFKCIDNDVDFDNLREAIQML